MGIRWVVGLFSLLLLSACSTTRSLPAIDVYTLALADDAVEQTRSSQINKVIKLLRVTGPQSYHSHKIIYRLHGQHFESYAYSRWSDSSTELISDYLQNYLQNSEVFSAVLTHHSVSQADWLLEIELDDFSQHIEASGQSGVHVSMQLNLLENKSKRLIASRHFKAEIAVEEANAKSAVLSFNRASAQISRQVLNWLQEIPQNLRIND